MEYVIFDMDTKRGFTGDFIGGYPVFSPNLCDCQLYYSKQEAIYLKKRLERNYGYSYLWVYSYSDTKHKMGYY